jgi:hypothetical protein
VAIERHLVGAGGLGNRIDTDRANALAVKQVGGGDENALAGRNYLRRDQIGFGTLRRNSGGHAS